MGSIVSATTGKAYGAAAMSSRADAFLDAAEVLLVQAQEDFAAGRYDLAMENAYRAALRTAGAYCAGSAEIRKRKRLPTNAWKKLALAGKEGEAWSRTFSAFSALRGRVASGIELDPEADVVGELLGNAEAFYRELRPEAVSGVA